MAQLNDTMVQGDLRVTGTTYSPLVRTDTILPVSYKATDNYTWGMATHEQTYGRFLWIDRHDGYGTSGVSYIITATTTGKTVNYGSTVYSNFIICDAWVPIAQNANNANQAYYAGNLSYAGPNGSRASTGEDHRTGSTYDSYLLLESTDTTAATKISSYAVTTQNVSAVSINASSTLSCGSGSSSVSFIPSGMTIASSGSTVATVADTGIQLFSEDTTMYCSITSRTLIFAAQGGGASMSANGFTGNVTGNLTGTATTAHNYSYTGTIKSKFDDLEELTDTMLQTATVTTLNYNTTISQGIYNVTNSPAAGTNGSPEPGQINLMVLRSNNFVTQLAFGDSIYYRKQNTGTGSQISSAWKTVFSY